MKLETIQLLADWLGDAEYGVNTLLPAVPRVAADAAAPPPIAKVLDPSRSDDAAQDDEGDDWPALVVVEYAPSALDPEVGTIFRDGFFWVAVALIMRDEDKAEAWRHASYYLRAVQRSIKQFLEPAHDDRRELHGVYVIAATQMRLLPWTTPLGELPHNGAVAVCFHVRDEDP